MKHVDITFDFFENLKVTFSFIFITKKKMGSKNWKNANYVRV